MPHKKKMRENPQYQPKQKLEPPLSAEELYSQIRELVAEEYGVDVKQVRPDADLDDDLGGIGNYIDIWEFLWVLERQYKIGIPISVVGTVQDLADYIGTQINKR